MIDPFTAFAAAQAAVKGIQAAIQRRKKAEMEEAMAKAKKR